MMLDKRSPYRMEPLPAKPTHTLYLYIVYTNAKKRREVSGTMRPTKEHPSLSQ